ncbi:MAG: helix-turn-helix domain-containing protein [Actinomycetota bacterium]|nr:helix-turn-helix domain-containing protein [Actinomycetota bacterium]
MKFDFDSCYRAGAGKDPRFDGMFIIAVTSTGIYCRPSCPAMTPKRANVRFYPTAAAAQAAGYRACKRCRPDASPGSPEWNVRADVVGRAMRLIADGIVDREGVAGLAGKLFVSERHLHRLLSTEVGAAPQALARACGAQTARVLIETTAMSFAEIAFAAGFSSIRQFNDTIKEVFVSTPSKLRAAKRGSDASAMGAITLRLPYRLPMDTVALVEFLAARAIQGIEESDGETYRRALKLPHSPGIVELKPEANYILCSLRLGDVRDLTAAVHRCRRLLDLDADSVAVDSALGTDPLLGPLVRRRPGLRVAGTVDGAELAVRAVIGQQISVTGARTIAGRLVAAFGKPLTAASGGLTHVWPDVEVLADADLAKVGLPRTRRATIRALATALAAGDIVIHPGADRVETRARLLELPGIGSWTASYVAMRALGDPDEFTATDLGVRHALERLGATGDFESFAERWKPWRAYAQQHLWKSLGDEETG